MAEILHSPGKKLFSHYLYHIFIFLCSSWIKKRQYKPPLFQNQITVVRDFCTQIARITVRKQTPPGRKNPVFQREWYPSDHRDRRLRGTHLHIKGMHRGTHRERPLIRWALLMNKVARGNDFTNSYPCLFAKMRAGTYPRFWVFALLAPGTYPRYLGSPGTNPPVFPH